MGQTDTLVQRPEELVVPGPPIQIELIALELVSLNPVDIGNGPEDLFVSLNTDLGGAMSANPFFGGFLVDSQLNFSFDLSGSVSGFILTGSFLLESSGVLWEEFNQTDTVSQNCDPPATAGPVGTSTHVLSGDPSQLHTVENAHQAKAAPSLSSYGIALTGAFLGAAILFGRRARKS